MKKRLTFLILIASMTLIVTACGSSDDEPEQTRAQRKAERFEVDEELVLNFYEACESISMPENTIRLDAITLSEDKSMYIIEFSYEEYAFKAIATTDYNITDITSEANVYMQDGTVIRDASFLPTMEQCVTLQFQAEQDVKDNLIAPATAEFPGHFMQAHEWGYRRDGNTFSASSWVDAQNENGALIRYNFTATYDWDGTDDTDPVLIDLVISQ